MHTILSFDLLRAAFPLNNQRRCTQFFSVAGQKCCRFTFLQTTDMFNLYISCVSFQHFNNPCHIMFILHVHELMFMPGNGGDSAGVSKARHLPSERPLLKAESQTTGYF